MATPGSCQESERLESWIQRRAARSGLLPYVLTFALLTGCVVGSGQLASFGGTGSDRLEHNSGGTALIVELQLAMKRGSAQISILDPGGRERYVSHETVAGSDLDVELAFKGMPGLWTAVVVWRDGEGSWAVKWRE